MALMDVVVPKYDSSTGRPKMVIMGSNGDAYVVPWAPRQVDFSELAEDVQEIERPGRVPDIAVKSPKNRKMSFSFMIGKDRTVSCMGDIRRLKAIVDVGGWVQVLYGEDESGLWKVTDFTYSTVERTTNNQVSRATVTFSFVEVPDSRRTVAKYSSDFNFRDDAVAASISQSIVNISKSMSARSNGDTSAVGNPTVASSSTTNGVNLPHVVQQGDTLLKIAQQYYGPAAEQFWRIVGDVNKVVGSLRVGQVLRIP